MVLVSSTFLRVSFTHAPATAASALDGSDDAIHVRGSAPLLVRQNINSKLLLSPLNQFHIRQHAVVLETA